MLTLFEFRCQIANCAGKSDFVFWTRLVEQRVDGIEDGVEMHVSLLL
jgi:hypothetical protein